MDTKKFRTMTYLQKRNNYHGDAYWGIAIDIGYSGTKIFAQDVVASFPSFAKKTEGTRIVVHNASSNEDILYRESKGSDVWLVGKEAQNALDVEDPNVASSNLYGRNRYSSSMFPVIVRTALAIATDGNTEGKKIFVQTGLPSKYLTADKKYLIKAIAGEHSFDMKFGDKAWKHYDITIAESNVSVIPQPMGALMSVTVNDLGVLTNDSNNIFSSRSLVVDPGFGTMDCITLVGRTIVEEDQKTSLDASMKEVLSRTSAKIFKKYGEEIPVQMMQMYLETGKIQTYNEEEGRGSIEDFSDLLEEANAEVAQEAISFLIDNYGGTRGDFRQYNNIVLTGGTGEAWFDYFQEFFSRFPWIKIISGNEQSDLPFIFSNVRGSYFLRQLIANKKKEAKT